MSVLSTGFGDVGGYQLQRSLRFRASASAKLTRTPSSAGNRRTFTISMWVKRGQLSASFATLYGAGANADYFSYQGDRLDVLFNNATYRVTANALFRDPSAFYHVVLRVDTTQATAADRVRLYVNGEQLTSLLNINYPIQNYECAAFNTTTMQEIGWANGGGYFDGYLSDVHFIDGQSLAPTSFGQFDSNGMWQPRPYTGTYGVNGFELDFADNTSTTTLMADRSGNGNNWTANNISLTAGATYDSMIDVPLGGGGGERGNYATLNALHAGRSTLTNGNLTASGATDLPTIVPESGTWYFERGGSAQTWTPPAAFPAGSGDYNFGQRPWQSTGPTGGQKALHTGNLPAPLIQNPKLHFDVATRLGTGATYTTTGRQFQPDLLWAKHRGDTAPHALTDSVRGTGAKFLHTNDTGAEDGLGASLTSFNADGYTAAVGSSNFSYLNTVSSTYVDWLWKAGGAPVTNNAGSISAQVSANPVAGFSIVTATSNGADPFTIGHGLGVAPRMVVFKNRDVVDSWYVAHAGLSSMASHWLRLDSTAAVASGTAIFGTGPTATTISIRSTSLATNGTKVVAYCFAEIPGYSRIGSYTGNGNADGPFVYCGFRPRWIMMKSSNDTFNWMIFDTARGTTNVMNNAMLANDSAIEQVNALWNLDILSNGFKPRGTSGNINGGGTNYIFYAIAEAPFQSALAR
jgi:hypothetical protein